MNAETLEKICRKVYRSHPEVGDVKPKVSKQGEDKYLLLFTNKATLSNNRQITHIIRVVSSSQGEILKISSSRG